MGRQIVLDNEADKADEGVSQVTVGGIVFDGAILIYPLAGCYLTYQMLEGVWILMASCQVV